MKSHQEYNNIKEKWLNKLSRNDKEKIKKSFRDLFVKLYNSENTEIKITNKFMEIMKKNFKKKESKKMNFMLIGPSGVGKSTLINALLKEDLAKEGSGRVCTLEIKKYQSKNIPFLCLIDSRGAELGKNHNLEDIQNETINLIVEKLNNSDPNEHIHCIIYCVTSNRFYEEELKIIIKIRQIYDGNKLPIVIVYTMGNNYEKVKSVRETINAYLEPYDESISNNIFDSFGINFLKLYAKEDKIQVNDKIYFQKCFGLSDLISICYKKGEKCYKIAIKNSLIQIAEECCLKNIKRVSDKMKKDKNLFLLFLSQNFDPNFNNFMAYIFEKMANVEKFEDLNNIEFKRNYDTGVQEIKKNKESNFIITNNCIYCQRDHPKSPYKCIFCGNYSCEECYLMQFSDNIPKCKICNGINFEQCNDINELNFSNNLADNIDNSNNFENILNNNLNYNSINEINKLIKDFQEEILKIMKNEFDDFTKQQAHNIYVNILEKFNESSKKENHNIHEAMKSKDQIEMEAINELKKSLKARAEENFLKNTASFLFIDIIETFQSKMEKNIENYVENIQNNRKIQELFKSFDILEPDKEIKLGEDFKKYIDSLKEIERKSYEKSLKYENGENVIYSNEMKY